MKARQATKSRRNGSREAIVSSILGIPQIPVNNKHNQKKKLVIQFVNTVSFSINTYRSCKLIKFPIVEGIVPVK